MSPARGAVRRAALTPAAVVVNPRARGGDAALPAWVARREPAPGEPLAGTLHRLVDEGARVIGAVGGDGSAGCAAAVAAARRRVLLPLPGGTLNHFARELGLGTIEAAARALEAGWVARVDAGEADGQLFVNNASLGLYGDLVRRRERLQELGIPKWPALALAMAATLRGAKPLELEIDGRPERAYIVFAGNNAYSGLGLGGRASLQAGTLDLMVLRARRPFPRLAIVVATLLGQLPRSRRLARRPARRVRIRLSAPAVLAHDGEVRPAEGEITLRSLPGALEVVVPPPSPRQPS